jgi:fermentation-respiration switch protein FrsA (DUF1100 family)
MFSSSLRFQLLLGLAKQIIFFVDSVPVRFNLLTHSTGTRVMEIPQIGHPVAIDSGDRRLAGWYVEPVGSCTAASLMFQGIGDRMEYWRRAQHWLAEARVATLVFHYSGYPGSGGRTTPESLDQDARSTYAWLRRQCASGTPVFLLGFSLGSGLAAQVAGSLYPPPSGLILSQAFTSLREAAARIVRPASGLARLLPDIWVTRESVATLTVPLLVIHSTGDALFPVSMAEQLFASAKSGGAPAELSVFEGYAHNAPHFAVPEDYWKAIRDFILRTSAAPADLRHALP